MIPIKKFLEKLRGSPQREILTGSLIVCAMVLIASIAKAPQPSPDASSGNPPPLFFYSFNVPGTLYEADTAEDSSSPYWWVDSGAELIIHDGFGGTIRGALPVDDPWRMRYAASNPKDTDNGYHPQNIFRLVTKYSWTDYEQQVYFRIEANNLSKSPNRNESNGLLLFNRYQDADNLYYAGIRVDGNAVIKKKQHGTYTTLALNKIFPGTYDPARSPNLLPLNTWLGLRTDIATDASGTVAIALSLDKGRTGDWILIATSTDDGTHFGPPIEGPAHLGIRTDFMDVELSDYQVVQQ